MSRTGRRCYVDVMAGLPGPLKARRISHIMVQSSLPLLAAFVQFPEAISGCCLVLLRQSPGLAETLNTFTFELVLLFSMTAH